MNRFGTLAPTTLFLHFLFSLLYFIPGHGMQSFNTPDPQRPIHTRNTAIYADLDTTRGLVYVLLENGLWKYELQNHTWSELEVKGIRELPFDELEFGLNEVRNSLQLWSRGAGEVYEIDLNDLSLKRIDRSFRHKNQFGHYPFIYNGTIYAFGGYGFWEWHNIITFFNSNIKEWNLVNVHPESSFPQGRIPQFGQFIPKKEELYILGGEGTVDSRQDDINASRIKLYDLWKYSFETAYWEKIDEIELNGFDFFSPTQDFRIHHVNKISSSFYSNNSNIWYLPVTPDGGSKEVFYLKPYHIPSKTEYSTIEIPASRSKQFLITNYLFDQSTNNLVLVGLDFLTNTQFLPVRIRQIPEDSLHQLIYKKESGTVSYFYIAGVFIIVALLFFIFYKWNFSKRSSKLDVQEVTSIQLDNLKWLNDDERKMINFLITHGAPVETMDLEEFVWPHIDNYDYRRKLRNETINSINKKFGDHFLNMGDLVLRERDPNDNRRFRYFLNSSFRVYKDLE